MHSVVPVGIALHGMQNFEHVWVPFSQIEPLTAQQFYHDGLMFV
jgi:hypothetical protein